MVVRETERGGKDRLKQFHKNALALAPFSRDAAKTKLECHV